ncbi:hypothetical protein QN362_08240 [Actimicrobium sp. CCC2.4]|uniref:hypothetical protein n=1 Tax=Actimicrobium sp. CCC2.4 TaxID=3048606 RepID=UPI002AC93748|nr:hypothetical protein [Actimicrobium sp. CCC2.4]MEB0135320.1 hypothetical protein [Actimicrobium sp. CCC2.4]WPX31109.1 hypothetical protein RHM62_12700 [Actimicrobium sp. CCC2.4]
MRRLPPPPAHGFAAATALFAIALFVLLGFVASSTARDGARAEFFHSTKDQMVAQRDLIANMLVLCRAVYPDGDNGTPFRISYPATPADGFVTSLLCPKPALSIWSGDASAMKPRPMAGFTPWSYINDAVSIRIFIDANETGSLFYRNLLDAVIAKVGSTQAVRSGDRLTITLVSP